jgi:hypothetical protein
MCESTLVLNVLCKCACISVSGFYRYNASPISATVAPDAHQIETSAPFYTSQIK